MRHTATSPAPPVRNHILLHNLSHARCAHQVHQAREMDDTQDLDTMIGVAILLVEDRRRNRGQEHLVRAHPQAVPSTIPSLLSQVETQEIRGRPETHETREILEAIETLETQGIGAVRHLEG
ncbi:hypothetical protein N7530_011654 [Penicillium desertorum]|uniref:Uncharacterized protein n=1 Tax=Penicillium desertorum TaxID=1303715 RepID=A0A9W9WDU5_9EURO|nr:hypothetical protein N7530_011654 [Penicillium desertorum]